MKTLTFMFAMLCANILSISMLFGSDHGDAPLAKANPYADIADVYAFMDGDKLIVALTTHPDLGCKPAFPNNVEYYIHIDTDGDAKDEFTFIYEPGSATPVSGTLAPLITRSFMGRREDPFFISLLLNGKDSNLGLDVAAIVLEIPKRKVAINGPVVGVWATTEKSGDRIDRMGDPLKNILFTRNVDNVQTLLTPICSDVSTLDEHSRDLFNKIPPEFDLNPIFPSPPPPQTPDPCQSFGAGELLLDPDYVAGGGIPFLLGIKGQNEGDILRIDTSNPNSSFPNSGRALTDDVVDTMFFLANKLKPPFPVTDNLIRNDVPFLGGFPYLAEPNLCPKFAFKTSGESQETSAIPQDFELGQAYPNPFNPSTTIEYALPADGMVSLKVYNIIGEEIRTLVNESQTASRRSVTWDGKDNSGREVASGIYIYRINVSSPLQTGSFSQSRRMSLLK